ncbi:hypothetical protein [Acinetobacter sp. MD2(2019)]|uniref:hypothetical protein n=1 Tax=Acinetobacter sp. MD2(2019) TaxID=2605273 RepID=UPI002D1F650F|nr:hypothetical protein [Acinetobacter sp. MD2(2019)]MEB3753694.1 hypothetical protein [Acinetobacter sp. MD2(2019)]
MKRQTRALFYLKQAFYFYCLRFFKITLFQYRHLTENEIKLAYQVFGPKLNYTEILILNMPYLPWQPVNLFMAPTGRLFVNPENYKADYSLESLAYKGIFIHELTHIYQYQQGIQVLFKGAILQTGYYLSFKRYNPYQYTFKEGKSFWDYNIEQQAEIAKDIFLNRIPNIILAHHQD